MAVDDIIAVRPHERSRRLMIPVILDTDIGVDIDDHWAVALLLGSPELDVKLITVTSGDVEHRADLLTQLLVEAGRPDIPIALGLRSPQPLGLPPYIMPSSGARYSWKRYPGPTFLDGVGEIVRVVTSSPDPVTIISICQMTTLAAALDRAPAITENSSIVSMSACLEPALDANAAADAHAYRRVLEAPWKLSVAPTEICYDAVLRGTRWERVRMSRNPVAQMILRDYQEWFDNNGGWGADISLFDYTPADRSSWLWDTVAVAMAYGCPFIETETLLLEMTADSIVRQSVDGYGVVVATGWLDLGGFLDDLLDRVLARSF